MWFHVASLRVCFTYVIMWNDGVGYNAKNEISSEIHVHVSSQIFQSYQSHLLHAFNYRTYK